MDATTPPPSQEMRWGFCRACSRWRYTDGWWGGPGHRPACPACGEEPSPLETVREGRGRTVLILDVPPGVDLPSLT